MTDQADTDALDEIRSAWVRWAKHELSEAEFTGRVAHALERAGRPVIAGMAAKGEPVDRLARELWEAHATHHQEVIPMPQLHWDELDPFSQDHWRHIARAALAFR